MCVLISSTHAPFSNEIYRWKKIDKNIIIITEIDTKYEETVVNKMKKKMKSKKKELDT